VSKVFVVFTMLVLAGFGVASLFWTQALFDQAGIALTTSTAVSEIRAFYGGLEIGLALTLLVSLVRRWPEEIVLTIIGISFTCVALARAGSALTLSDDATWTLVALCFEVLVSIAAFVLLFLASRRRQNS